MTIAEHARSACYYGIGRLNQLVNKIETRYAKTRLFSRPVYVDLILTKACNFACVFCKDYETPFGSLRASLENIRNVARQLFPYAMRLNICSGGEPYLHKGLEDVLRLAKSYGLQTWVLSNGSMLTESRIRTIVREGLITEHGFSVDGFKAETVEAIRVNANLNVILENIALLQRIKKEERKKSPRIIMKYALMRSNIEELPATVQRWGEMECDELRCEYLSLANDMDDQSSLYYHQELMEECFEKARKIAASYPKLRMSLPPLIRLEKQRTAPSNCVMPWFFVMIDANGQVMPCYRSFEALRLGRLYDGDNGKTFAGVWNSGPYQELRRTVNNDRVEKYFPYCRECENRCGWGDEKAHLGDRHWMEVLGPNWLPKNIDHRRPSKGNSRLSGKEASPLEPSK